MSSMRNAVQRRPHRERAQPLERRRLGLLEKHKDYSLRAKDYNKKKEQLKTLRQKAADRNEDEFYFGMMSRKGAGSRIQGGKRWTGTLEGDRGNASMDVDTVRLLKTQDLGYVRTMRQVALKEVARLKEQLVLSRGFDSLDEVPDEEEMDADLDDLDDIKPSRSGSSQEARKILFMDDEEQQIEAVQQAEDDDDDDVDLEDLEADEGEEDESTQRAKSIRRVQLQLEQAQKKLKALTQVEERLDVQRAKMAKTATSGGQTRKGKKIMVRARKR